MAARSASASGQADSFYHSEWADYWWSGPETWASGGSYQNAIYDDYTYQWTKTWQGQGDGTVTSSAANHVTGIENGSENAWSTHTVSEGKGDGYSSSSSWSGSWNPSYDQTVTYPGFYDYRYYGRDYGGSGEEDYIAYMGDVFYDHPGSDTGFFPFA
ncbi:MAG: hypothetical protein H5U08_10300, partial [Thermogutta sp.]|uniref:hypothetical protein n=1 Tax=Thermogutta sp. TaxID=1962930 RepID=UPI0019AF5A93